MKTLLGFVVVAAVLAAGVAGYKQGSAQASVPVAQVVEPSTNNGVAESEYRCIGNNHAEPTGLQVTASISRLDRDGVLDLTLENFDDSEVSVIHEIVIVDPFGTPITTVEQTEVYPISAREKGHAKSVALVSPEVDGYYTISVRTAGLDAKGAAQMRTDRVWVKVVDGSITTVERDEYETNSGEAEAQSI